MRRRDSEGVMPFIKGLLGMAVIVALSYYIYEHGEDLLDSQIGDKGIERSYSIEQRKLIDGFEFKEEKEYTVSGKEIRYETRVPYIMGEIEVGEVELEGGGESVTVRMPIATYNENIVIGDRIKVQVGEDEGYMLSGNGSTVYKIQEDYLTKKGLTGAMGVGK